MARPREPKTAKGRAASAIRIIRECVAERCDAGRRLDHAFESGDGDEVLHYILQAAVNDPELQRVLRVFGAGCWLETDYYAKNGLRGVHPFIVKERERCLPGMNG